MKVRRFEDLEKAAAEAGGHLLRVRIPKPPPGENGGCGAPTHVEGTNGGTLPCGATLHWPDGTKAPYYCPACQQLFLRNSSERSVILQVLRDCLQESPYVVAARRLRALGITSATFHRFYTAPENKTLPEVWTTTVHNELRDFELREKYAT